MPRYFVDQIRSNDIAPVMPPSIPKDLDWTGWSAGQTGGLFVGGGTSPKLPRNMQGDDIVFLRVGNDVRWLGAGNDFGFGNAGDDTIFGDSGNDWIMGGGGDDTILGGAGNDVLIGGLDDDILVGGAGADVFIFTEDHRQDVIKDFDVTEDVIRLGPSVEVFAIIDTPEGALIATQEGSIVVENVDAQMLGDANLLTF